MATTVPVPLDTPIAVKITFRGQTKRYKLQLKDTSLFALPKKVKELLDLDQDANIALERWSDSNTSWVTLSPDEPHVYKTLFRAAKAKLKLRLRVTIPGEPTANVILPHNDARVQRMPSQRTLVEMRESPAAPAIAHSPVPIASTYKKPTVESEDAAPVSYPTPPSPPKHAEKVEEIPSLSKSPEPVENRDHSSLAFRPKATHCSHPRGEPKWIVFCDNCNQSMENEHFHCSICANNDFDLCLSCVEKGAHCKDPDHWMVKRFVRDGQVENSSTERLSPKTKPAAQLQAEQGMPGAFMDEKQPVVEGQVDEEDTDRTCNCCVKVLPETEFVTCTTCEDYDLCIECHMKNKHGHHPGHAFEPATPDTRVPQLAQILCSAGRNVRHNALCDNCNKYIYGVRHKCLNCPDWDYCSDCFKKARHTHPHHRFAPIYEPLSSGSAWGARHFGIFCDGPLCSKNDAQCIEGVRYKCAVCHDTDFCANCEAHPTNKHNHTHPLIKFKTPVRNVSVTTLNEGRNGAPTTRLGDNLSKNAATQVQTVLDVKPVVEAPPKPSSEKINIRNLLSPAEHQAPPKPPTPSAGIKCVGQMNAHLVRETIPDGTQISAGMTFVKTWTLANSGPAAWPAGCRVQWFAGDHMFNVNMNVVSHDELIGAMATNVVDSTVKPGEEIVFRVVLKAGTLPPDTKERTAISYWQLKTATGSPIGSKVYCDIKIVEPPQPTSPRHTIAPQQAISMDDYNHSIDRAPTEVALARLRQAAALRNLALQQEQMRRFVAENPTVKPAAKSDDPADEKKAEETTTAELPVEEKKAVEEKPAKIASEDKAETESKAESSGMIFPQLDKESPVASTESLSALVPLNIADMDDGDQEPESSTAAPKQDDEDAYDDLESVEIRSFSSHDEDGFMTDEEYDILNASDQEDMRW